MTDNWPPLDLHAHVDVGVAPNELLNLRAVVFAASRTLAESRTALDRQATDLLTVWGVGVHPGVKAALESFDRDSFSALVDRTAYVGEVGLDGKVQSRLTRQREVLAEVLTTLQVKPRITSLHSYGATHEVLEALEAIPIQGVVLHWWLGDVDTTRRAVELGAFFSVNPSNLKNGEALDQVPIERLLTETDHPDGDRWSTQPRQPGNVTKVEAELARRRGMDPRRLRRAAWSNLKSLVETVSVSALLPPRVNSILMEA